jgi:S1-C subfamily serine protease
MNFKLDVNYLDSLIKTSQSTEKFEDPIKKTIQLGLQASCSIYVRSGKKNWSGSGFHVGNNIIITAGHVVPTDETLTEILITFDNKNFIPATFLTSDPTIDSGAVRAERIPSNIPTLQLANSDTVEVGDIVAVIGSPEGFHDTATVGRVSNVHQSINDVNMPAWNNILFVDADILEGSSGGMVIGTDNLVYGTIMGVTGQHADIGVGENAVCPSNKITNMLSKLV